MWRWPVVVAAGAALGWWMFHFRGAALFAGIGFAATLAFATLSRHAPRAARAVVLVGAALALRSSATLGWAGADALDGSRFKASPVGLSHVLTPARLESRTIDCGWHAASGYPAPCAIGDPVAFARLRMVYPLLLAAALLALAGGLLAVGRGAPWGQAQQGLAAVAGLGALGALVLFAASVRPALAAIAGLPIGVGGTLGTMQLSLACLLLLTAALHPAPRGLPSRSASGSEPIAAGAS